MLNNILIIILLFVGVLEFTDGFKKPKRVLYIPVIIWYWGNIFAMVTEFKVNYNDFPITDLIYSSSMIQILLLILVCSFVLEYIKRKTTLYKASHYMENKTVQWLIIAALVVSVAYYKYEFKYNVQQRYLLLVFSSTGVIAAVLFKISVQFKSKNSFNSILIKLYYVTNVIMILIILLFPDFYKKYGFEINKYPLFGIWATIGVYLISNAIYGRKMIRAKN